MMYVLQVMALEEERVYKKLNSKGYKAFLPQQVKYQRKEGAWHTKTVKLFDGYVFVESDLKYDEYEDIQNTEGVIRFLTGAGAINPEPLGEVDTAFIKWLANDGEVIKPLTVKFDNNFGIKDRITILDGWFQLYKDKVIKVDKRQKRIKVALDFATEQKEVTLYINDITHAFN